MLITGKTVLKFIAIVIGVLLTLILLLAAYVLVDFSAEQEPPSDRVNLVNDITRLNPIEVATVIAPQSIADIQHAIRTTEGKISIGGGRYSQGGQIALEDHLHLDMRNFDNVVSFDPLAKEITVQSGMRWRAIQEVIDPAGLSIRIMQSYANFTVGGSLSVNVHGRYVGEGPIIRSVKSITVVLADGSIVRASPEENAEVFYGVIGGYGGLGVIAEATLELVPNVKVGRETDYMAIEHYAAFFEQNVRDHPNVVFHNATIYPPDFTHVNSVSWVKTEKPLTVHEKLVPRDREYWWQPRVAKFVADSNFGKWMRQHIFEPFKHASDPVQWRNYEASYDVRELEPKSRADQTYALREYFVPVERFDSFSAKMTDIFKAHDLNVLNVSVRHALPDSGSLLAWAREEVFAFVVYYRQGTTAQDREHVKAWSREMIDAVISEGGSYYLPYQLHATTEQFHSSYPHAEEFFALKKKLDPTYRFSNKLWEQHYQQ